MEIPLAGAIVIAMISGGLIGFAIAEGVFYRGFAAGLLTTFDVPSKILLKLEKAAATPASA